MTSMGSPVFWIGNAIHFPTVFDYLNTEQSEILASDTKSHAWLDYCNETTIRNPFLH